MEDLLGALMQGNQQQPEPENTGADADPLAQLLQGMMGGQTAQAPSAPAASGPSQGPMGLGGLLQGLLGGAGGLPGGTGEVPGEYGSQAETGAAPGTPHLGGLLQGLLGGAGGLAPATGQAPAGGASGMADILGMIMGSGSPALESNNILAPIVNRLAEKIGLPPQVAQAVVAFVLGKLMERRLQPGVDTAPASTRSQAASLEDVVQRMNSGRRVTKTGIRSAGLARELAAHTGLDRATAEASLQEVLNALGGQLTAGQ